MKYILIILLIFVFDFATAQSVKIRKTADANNSGVRTFDWEIYNSQDPDVVLSSGSASHSEIMLTNRVLKGLLDDLLVEYKVTNNISADTEERRTWALAMESDQATGANTNPVNLPGLVFTYAANSLYKITICGKIQPTAATSGCGLQFDVSTAVNNIDISFYHQLANTGTLTGGHSIADDASVGVSSGFPGTSTYTVNGFGFIRSGANTGTAQLRLRSEASTITAKGGFILLVEKVR